MGIISRIKGRLPVIGAGGGSTTTGPATGESSSAAGAAPASSPAPTLPTAPASDRGDQDAQSFISGVVSEHPVTLFMKGNPDQPQCGFSANAVAILRGYGQPIKHVDVLLDPEIRQGIKEFSNWPTIPQIYVGGEFLGGSDILGQMHESGELGEVISAAASEGGE